MVAAITISFPVSFLLKITPLFPAPFSLRSKIFRETDISVKEGIVEDAPHNCHSTPGVGEVAMAYRCINLHSHKALLLFPYSDITDVCISGEMKSTLHSWNLSLLFSLKAVLFLRQNLVPPLEYLHI